MGFLIPRLTPARLAPNETIDLLQRENTSGNTIRLLTDVKIFDWRAAAKQLRQVGRGESASGMVDQAACGNSAAWRRRKRHIFTDTGGLLVTVQVYGANVQDRDGAPVVLASVRRTFPRLRHVFADQAYSGPKLAAALKPLGRWRVEIVKRPANARTFEVLPRRWVVERTLAWLSRNRRLAKDFEATLATAQTWLFLTSVQLLLRRLTRL